MSEETQSYERPRLAVARGNASLAPAAGYGSAAYRGYVLAVLALIYACHALDRGIPNLVVDLVKRDFALSDTQAGLFTGTLFGVAFAIAGVPLGFVSDRVNRRNMLGAILVLWSGLTSLGGFATVYPLLLASRFGVGAAEAGAAPIAMPMLSDIFPPEKRAFVIGLFYTSVPIGGGLANWLGARAADAHGWQAALLLAGAPGLLLALLLFATVREPRRGGVERSAASEPRAGFAEVLSFLARRPGLLCLVAGCALCGFVAISTGAWLIPFLTRVHGYTLAQLAPVFVVSGVVGASGYPLIGWLADRAARSNPAGPLRLVAAICAGGLGLGLASAFMPNGLAAIALYVAFGFLTHSYAPPCYAALLANTPAEMRGTLMSLLQLTTNLLGFGIGPAWVGAVSDALGGGAAIRFGLAAAMSVLLLVAALLLAAARLLYAEEAQRGLGALSSASH
jgi:MFS family permease